MDRLVLDSRSRPAASAGFGWFIGCAVLASLAVGVCAQAAERPPVMGPTAGVSAGDPLTTAAASRFCRRAATRSMPASRR